MQALWGLMVLLGMIVGAVSLIGLIWAALKKRNRRRWLSAILVGIAMFIIGMVFAVKTPVPAPEQEKAAAAPIQKANSTAAPSQAPVSATTTPVVAQSISASEELTSETVLKLIQSGIDVSGSFKITKANIIKIDILQNAPSKGKKHGRRLFQIRRRLG